MISQVAGRIRLGALALAVVCLFQGCTPEHGWSYGGPASEDLYSVITLEDGSLLATGHSGPYHGSWPGSWSDGGIYLLKVNPDGTGESAQVYQEPGRWIRAKGALPLADGRLFLVGSSYNLESYRESFYAMSLAVEGSVVWGKRIATEQVSSAECYATVNASDGSVVLAGIGNGRIAGGYKDLCLVKVQQDGNVDWVAFGADEGDEGAFAIGETANGGFVAAGQRYEYAIDGDEYIVEGCMLVVSTDADGQVLWEREFVEQVGVDAAAYAVAELPDGSVLIGGASYREECLVTDVVYPSPAALLVKTDAEGNLIWMKTFGGPCEDTAYINGMLVAQDGVVLLGRRRGIYLRKIDFEGELIWERRYPGGWGAPYVNAISETTDGGFALAGSLYPATFPILRQDTDAYLLRLDAEGLPVEK